MSPTVLRRNSLHPSIQNTSQELQGWRIVPSVLRRQGQALQQVPSDSGLFWFSVTFQQVVVPSLMYCNSFAFVDYLL